MFFFSTDYDTFGTCELTEIVKKERGVNRLLGEENKLEGGSAGWALVRVKKLSIFIGNIVLTFLCLRTFIWNSAQKV